MRLSTRRRSRPRPRPPAPLVALLVAVGIAGVAWSLLTPAWQAPDENAHFAYVQSIAERGELPGTPGRPLESTEQRTASRYTNADQTAGNLLAKPAWSERQYHRWRQVQGREPRDDGGGPAGVSSNPPLYYLAEVVPYEIAHGGDAVTRLIALRLGSVVWLLVTCVGAWLLAGEVFPRRPLLQVVATATASLLPMMDFVSASVSPDCLLYATWAFFAWIGVRILKRGLTTGRAALLGGLLAAAILTKATSYALVPAALLVLAVGVVRRQRAGAPALAWMSSAGAGVAAVCVPLAAWFVTTHLLDRSAAAQVTAATSPGGGTNVRELLDYVWEYYLPRLPFMQDFSSTHVGVPGFGLSDVWLDQSAGAFGWLEVRWPPWAYLVWYGVVSAVTVGFAASLVRFRRGLDGWMLGFFGLMLVALLAGLHWTDYHFGVTGVGFNQARYLFPLLPLAGLALAQALALLRRDSARRVAVGVVLTALAVFQVLSMGLVAERFYA